MKSVPLKAFQRSQVRRGEVKKLRATGRVPATIYGRLAQPQNLEVNSKEIADLLNHSASENLLVDLTVENDPRSKRLALVQEVQHHPLDSKVLHVDFHEVAENEKVIVQVPVETTGEAAGVKNAGGVMELMSPVKFVDTAIPRGRAIKHYPIYRDILKADLVINVPIAKQHPISLLTLGGKNLLGCVTNRQNLHFDIGQTVADLASVIKPGLTIVDAVRILTANGPTGGNLADVVRKDTVIASSDMVAADSSAATLFGLSGTDIPYVRASAAMGLGKVHLGKLKVATLKV